MNGSWKRKCEHLPNIDTHPAAVATITKIIVLSTDSVTVPTAIAML
jgi:hypothetical protein